MNLQNSTLYVPSIRPIDCLHIAKTPYEGGMSKQKEYLLEHIPQAEVLDSKNFNKWRISLIRIDSQLVISFEGTSMTSLSNWLDNTLHHISYLFHDNVYCQTTRFFEQTITDWKKNYTERISVFTGHPAGGCFASHVLTMMKVVRVTFNSHLAHSGSLHCNLATKNDLVSALPGHEHAHIVVGAGLHRLKYFFPISLQKRSGLIFVQ
jgi:hypothetical protein